ESPEAGKGKENVLKQLADMCYSGVFVMGSKAADFRISCLPGLSQYPRYISNETDVTRIYYKTEEETVQKVPISELDKLWGFLEKTKDTLPVCMKILGEKDNPKEIGNVFKATSVFLEDLSPFWQEVLSKMRSYEINQGLYSKYNDPNVLKKIIPKCHRWQIDWEGCQYNTRAMRFGMDVQRYRTFEAAYLFVFGIAILDKYQKLLLYLAQNRGDAENTTFIHAISGLVINPAGNQSVYQAMQDAIAMVKNSYLFAESQGTFKVWCYQLTREEEPCVSHYLNVLNHLYSRQLLGALTPAAFRERVLPLHAKDGGPRFANFKNHLFYATKFWEVGKQKKMVEKIGKDHSIELESQLSFIQDVLNEGLFEEHELLAILVAANYFEAFHLFFSVIANQYYWQSPDGSPLHTAVAFKCTQSLQLLLELQADPNIKNIGGLTPLDLAKDGHWREGIRILQSAGAIFSEEKKKKRGVWGEPQFRHY
ncbi:MAG TPA: ankyrin repeat domain-containing protein, partial [Chlamydiales bacterium]|nr:ankyrin repeat domain-containing protein [Chlamydiales bacterium]